MRSFRKTLLLFLAILILPTILFSVYEIGSLRENEGVIESIYNNQLDAILYSINQYSNDIMSSWANGIEQKLNLFERTQKLTDENRIISDYTPLLQWRQYNLQAELLKIIPASSLPDSLSATVGLILVQNDSTLRRLHTYLRAGYRKIQAFAIPNSHLELVVYLSESSQGLRMNVLVIDPRKFIQEVLDPKIQEIARNQFYITASLNDGSPVFYSSDKQYTPKNIGHSKPFWLLHEYSLGIELKDKTIADLARSRSKRNIFLVLFIDLVLFLGIFIIYRNVKKQLELSQLKSDFVSGVSHEIRTPLALISMYIETLEMGRVTSEEKIKEYYSIILHETQRLSGIVSKILNFSRIESGKRKYSFTETKVDALLIDALAAHKYTLEAGGFQYQLSLSENIPEILADADAVSEAVSNLIDNAIKYSGNIKEIVVRAGVLKGNVFIEVEDKGIGISEREQKHIFDKFYRVVEKDLAHKAKGSGLGLSIVKHVLDAHRGKIEVLSQKNEGTTFRLLFPLKNKK